MLSCPVGGGGGLEGRTLPALQSPVLAVSDLSALVGLHSQRESGRRAGFGAKGKLGWYCSWQPGSIVTVPNDIPQRLPNKSQPEESRESKEVEIGDVHPKTGREKV